MWSVSKNYINSLRIVSKNAYNSLWIVSKNSYNSLGSAWKVKVRTEEDGKLPSSLIRHGLKYMKA